MASLRWNHAFDNHLRRDITLYYTGYRYAFGTPEDELNPFLWVSKIEDAGARYDFKIDKGAFSNFEFGASSIFHMFSPGKITSSSATSFFRNFELSSSNALESGIRNNFV